jgi:hypothetical protein
MMEAGCSTRNIHYGTAHDFMSLSPAATPFVHLSEIVSEQLTGGLQMVKWLTKQEIQTVMDASCHLNNSSPGTDVPCII